MILFFKIVEATRLVLFFVLFLPFQAVAAIYFERINSEHGLKSNYTNHIIQRRDGFIWIATAEGLSRFDGYDFVNYNADPDDPTSLTDDWILALFEDSKSRLWVGTDNGLSRLLPNENGFKQYRHNPEDDNSIASRHSFFFTEDSRGRIWIGTSQGFSLYREETDNFENFYPAAKSSANQKLNNVNFILEVDQDRFWLGTSGGLLVFDSVQRSIHPINIEGLSGNFGYNSVVRAKDGRIWFATLDDGVIVYDPATQTHERYVYQKDDPNSLSSQSTWHIGEDSAGNIWVTTWSNGVSIIDKKTNKITRLQYILADDRSIPHNQVNSVFKDSSGLIWLSTYDGIAYHNPHQAIENLRPIPGDKHSLSANQAWSFFETAGELWIGTNEGINRFDLKSGHIESFFSGKYGDDPDNVLAVWDIKPASKDQFWLGTEYGLALFNTRTKTLDYVNDLLTNRQLQNDSPVHIGLSEPTWVTANSENDSLWVATTQGKLFLINQELQIIKDFSELVRQQIGNGNIFEFINVVEDKNHNLWLATSLGLYYLDQKAATVSVISDLEKKKNFQGVWVNTIAPYGDNYYWLASYQLGLMLIEHKGNGQIKIHYSLNDSHPEITENNFLTVIPVDDKNIWFNSGSSLYRLNYENGQLDNFGKQNLKNDLNFHDNAQYKDSQGFLNFGTSRGVVRFLPDKVSQLNFSPRISFTKIETPQQSDDSQAFKFSPIKSDVPVHKLTNWSFPYSDNVIKFSFASLDYMRPWNFQYAYRLKGFSDLWTSLGSNRELTFTNLDAGRYTLEIRGTNCDLAWSEHQATLQFSIEPPPWRSWWAYCIYALLVFIFFMSLYRFRRQEVQANKALERSKQQLSQALWGSGDELWEWDLVNQHIDYVNRFDFIRARPCVFDGSKSVWENFIHPDDLDNFIAQINRIIQQQADAFESVYRQKCNDGSWAWLLDRAKVTKRDKSGNPLLLSGTTRNITDLKLTEEKNRLIASAFQSSTEGAVIYDEALNIYAINQAFTAITGLDSRIINNKIDPKFFLSSEDGKFEQSFYDEVMDSARKNGHFHGEVWFRCVNNDLVPVELRIASVENTSNQSRHYIATFTDIMFRKQAEADLRRLANFDNLTQLPNRTLLREQLNHGLLQAKRDNNNVAVLFLDLDNFKNVNDSLGHNVGDQLLIAVANRLTSCIRRTDTVARLGGDEFTIGLFGVTTIDQVIKLAENVLAELGKPYQLNEIELIISPSVGIAVSPQDGNDVDILLRHADTAMYHAKHKGKNNFQFFTKEMNWRVSERVHMEAQIRKAIDNKEFVLHYQPKFDISLNCIAGFEALLRWHHSEKGWIPPMDFIPIAEETGLIIPIGEMVLDSACQQLCLWREQHKKETHVAVNLSALQFRDKHLPLKIKRILNKYQISPHLLELEITESTLMEDMSYTQDMMAKLRDVGVKISLDDFGTGYSSLSYLKQFPINALKIDRSFVVNMANDSRDAKMVEAIISLAHNLDVRVVGEGIETIEQLNLLKSFKCEEIQGFLLSKPLSAQNALSLMNGNTDINAILSQQNLTAEVS